MGCYVGLNAGGIFDAANGAKFSTAPRAADPFTPNAAALGSLAYIGAVRGRIGCLIFISARARRFTANPLRPFFRSSLLPRRRRLDYKVGSFLEGTPSARGASGGRTAGTNMCWSGEASTVLATVGVSGALYAAYKKEPASLWGTLLYFAMMEALQAYTYTVINQCSLPANQIATVLGYLHIAFQPFFINAISMHFLPEPVATRLYKPVYGLCFVSAIIMLLQLYPFEWAGLCEPGRALCAARLCSVSGNWHIAWDVPSNGIGNWTYDHGLTGYFSYGFVAFILPLMYGSWRFTAYHFVMGPLMARMLTNNLNEAPAVWCLLSIGFLLIVIKTPVRKYLYVRWNLLWLWLFGYDGGAAPAPAEAKEQRRPALEQA